MKKSNLRERHEEMAEKEEPTLISKKKARHLCKRSKHDPHKATPHTKEVFSDGWTRWVCSKCGQVKFTKGMTFEEEKE